MNNIQELVSMLPKKSADKVDKMDCNFADGDCKSLGVVADYIVELESTLRKIEAVQFGSDGDCGVISILNCAEIDL